MTYSVLSGISKPIHFYYLTETRYRSDLGRHVQLIVISLSQPANVTSPALICVNGYTILAKMTTSLP